MLNRLFIFAIRLFAIFLISFPFISISADLEGVTHFTVNNKVNVEIPYGWTIRNEQEISSIKRQSMQLTGITQENITSLAADTRYEDTYYMSTRISFNRLNEFYSQKDFENDLKTYGSDQLLNAFTDELKTEQSEMNNKLRALPNGFVFDVDSMKAKVGLIDNRKTVSIQYDRFFPQSGETVTVEQNHIFSGDEVVIISLSFDKKCAYCKKMISKIRNSIHFIE